MLHRASLTSGAGINIPGHSNLAAGLEMYESIDALRAAAPLPDEAQRVIDQEVIQVGLDRLVVVADMLEANMVTDLPNAMSVLQLYHERASKVGHAKRTMTPSARGENQLIDRNGVRTPIYITMDDFSFNIRLLLASQRAGAPLDVAHVGQATRRVNEAIEDAAINGALLTVDGDSTPGILNAPNANSVTYKDGESWTHANHSGEDILEDVLDMIEAAHGDKMFGPYNLYINTAYSLKLENDFKAFSSDTIRQRLESIDVGGGRKLRVRVADMLGTDRTFLMQMTKDVADVIVGQQPTALSWQDAPGFERFFAIMAITVPRVRDTYTGQSGIVTGFTS